MTTNITGGSCLTAKGLDISLAALQRQDPYINNIVDVASQVALYTFNSKTNEWEKTDVEGTLFVYTRLASPRHGFTIMNRLSMENLTEPITKDLDFQLQDPFLLYRNARLSIHGIWFYDKTDCQRIAELMKNLTRQEQQLHQQHQQQQQQQQCGWVSPRALDSGDTRGVDILQMLTKARNEYDKGKPSSEPKEIGGGGGAIHDNPHLIKPIPLKPTDRQRLLQHKDGDSKPVSLASLFGPQAAAPPSFSQSHSGPSPGVGGRPAVARSLSYDDPSAQAVPVSPGGGPLLGAAPPPSSSSSSQPCAAIQKLMSGQRGAPEVQPPTESPDKRVCENGLQRGGGGGGGDPLQKLFPNPLSPHPPPPASSSSSSSSVSAPCRPVSHPPPQLALLSGLQAVHPMVTIAGAFQQHMQQHPHVYQHQHPHLYQHQQPQIYQHQQPQTHQYPLQPPPPHPHQPPPPHHQHRPPQQPPPPPPGQPLFYSPVKPLPPAALHLLQMSPGVLQPGQVNTGVHPPAQVGPGVLPAQVSSGVPPPGQVSAGVVSPHELLQRLQLVQQEQNLNQSQAPEHSRPPLAPCFHQPQNQNQTRPTETSTAGPAGLNSSQHFQSLPAPVGPALLISPSVFSQAPPPRSAPHPEEPRVLSRSQLQATLTHLIQNDSSFLDVIYEAYISRFVKDDGRPHY